MATDDLSLLGFFATPDIQGKVFKEPWTTTGLTVSTMTFDDMETLTMLAPAGAGDCGIFGNFVVPQNYASAPTLVIGGVLGEAANTLGFGFVQIGIDHSSPINVAFDDEDLASNSTWTGLVAGDVYEEIITITPASAFTVGQRVFYYFYREDTADTQTGAFHLTDLLFRYTTI